MISRGVSHDLRTLPALVAEIGGERVGLACYLMDGTECELASLASLDALREGAGAGTALPAAVGRYARDAGCTAVRVVTTNDNLRALRFCQRRGYRLWDLRAAPWTPRARPSRSRCSATTASRSTTSWNSSAGCDRRGRDGAWPARRHVLVRVDAPAGFVVGPGQLVSSRLRSLAMVASDRFRPSCR